MEKVIKLLEEFGFEIPHPMSREAALLTPRFWQMLVKAINWWPGYKRFKTTRFDGAGMHYTFEEPHVNLWKRFVDHLAEGKPADSFFEALLTNK